VDVLEASALAAVSSWLREFNFPSARLNAFVAAVASCCLAVAALQEFTLLVVAELKAF
jgi:hypothetical protein